MFVTFFSELAEVFLVKSVETQNNYVKEIERVLSIICVCVYVRYLSIS